MDFDIFGDTFEAEEDYSLKQNLDSEMNEWGEKYRQVGRILDRIVKDRKRCRKESEDSFQKADCLETVSCLYYQGVEEDIFEDNKCGFVILKDIDHEVYDLLEMCSRYNKMPVDDFIPQKPINLSFETLMSGYVNKRSKKVRDSRKELVKRYEYLSNEQQLEFRMALLRSGSKMDQSLACRYCLERFDGQELPLIESLLENEAQLYNDLWFYAGRVVCRHSSDDYLVRHQQSILVFQDKSVNKILCYFLALRLYGNPEFEFKKEWMLFGDYYRLLYYKKQKTDDNEWYNDFFALMAELYFVSSCTYKSNRIFTRSSECFNVQSCYYDSGKVRHNCQNLLDNQSVYYMLVFGAKLGVDLEMAFDYLHAVKDYCFENNNAVTSLKECCPKKYFHFFEEEWLSQYL